MVAEGGNRTWQRKVVTEGIDGTRRATKGIDRTRRAGGTRRWNASAERGGAMAEDGGGTEYALLEREGRCSVFAILENGERVRKSVRVELGFARKII